MLSTLPVFLALAVATSQDAATIAAVRAAAEREPIETFERARGSVRVRDIRLLDVDRDGSAEAFVAIEPSFRQTPTILVYRYHARRGASRLLEALVAGRLQPASGRLKDEHALGVGVDMPVGGGGRPVDVDRLISTFARNSMSLVRYRSFVHSDGRKGFVTYVDLADRYLPTALVTTCESLEFSRIEGLATGKLSGDTTARYLVALTARDVTIYRFRGIRPNGTLDKEVWIRDRPAGATALRLGGNGTVELAMRDGRQAKLDAP